MDSDYNTIFHDFNSMQCKISSLFKDVWLEKNHYWTTSQKLEIKLNNTLKEVNALKKENGVLLKSIKDLKSAIFNCFNPLSANMRNIKSIADYNSTSQVFKKNILNLLKLLREPYTINEIMNADKSPIEDSTCIVINEDSKTERTALKHKNTGLLEDKESDESIAKNCWMLLSNRPEELENICETKQGCGAQTSKDASNTAESRSPVFKKFNIKEPRCKEKDDSPENHLKEKHILRTPDSNLKYLTKRSLKDFRGEKTKGELSPGIRGKRLRTHVDRSPTTSRITKSNFTETVNSDFGSKKLTQTRLNMDVFKKFAENSPGRKRESKNLMGILTENKCLADGGEDDFICESPTRTNGGLTTVKKENVEAFANHSPVDLDETFVPLEVVNCRGDNLMDEKIVAEDEIPLRHSSPFKVTESEVSNSIDYDSVPFVYQKVAPKKKSERMKLPGYACSECSKYYKIALGDEANEDKFREVVNRCSRHRCQISPDAQETPPGYWKPYLTATLAEDDAVT